MKTKAFLLPFYRQALYGLHPCFYKKILSPTLFYDISKIATSPVSKWWLYYVVGIQSVIHTVMFSIFLSNFRLLFQLNCSNIIQSVLKDLSFILCVRLERWAIIHILKSTLFTFFKKNFMAHFCWWGSTASRLEPLQGGSLFFTTKFLEILNFLFILLAFV